jgi:hypothetical protein
MIIPLNLVKPCGLIAGDSVLLVQNLGRIGLVCQLQLQWDGIFDDNIIQGLQTSFEFGDMKHIMNLKDRQKRPEEEGGEWKPVKIPRGNSTYIPKLTRRPSLLTRPRPHSYRKSIGPRNRIRNSRRNINRCWQDPVRDRC